MPQEKSPWGKPHAYPVSLASGEPYLVRLFLFGFGLSELGKEKYRGFYQQSLWPETLHTLVQRSRDELLEDLAALVPLIEHLGGQSAIEDFFYALRDVTTWWP